VFNNVEPIYIQIVYYIKKQIVCGKFKPRDRLPSVRDFALMLDANPNTIQRALLILEESRVIYTESTNGKFVVDDEKIVGRLKKEIVDENICKLEDVFFDLGLTKEEIREIIIKRYGG